MHRLLVLVTATASALTFSPGSASAFPPAPPPAPPCRDRWQQPFSSTSIWNSAIGANATFVHAQIYTSPFNYSYGCALRVSAANRRVSCKAPGTNGKTPEAECLAAGCCYVSSPRPQCFIPAGGVPDAGVHSDQDVLVRAGPGDPLTPFLDRAWRGGGEECTESGPQRGSVPFPSALMVDCEDNNNAFALLLPDNVTLLQAQPLYRAAPGRPIMAQWPPTSPAVGFLSGWNTSILGEGATGAHGGSFLSSIGGTIRAGELSSGLIPHALKLEVFGHDYYWSGLYGAPPCYAWPALACDGYGNSTGWNGYAGLVPEVRPGALLAVPTALAGPLAARLTTAPARTILTALVNFGGYLVDDTAGDSAAICTEPAAIAELQAVFGISINITHPALENSAGPTGAFFKDVVAIFQSLHAVSNNAPGSVGGGGTPLAPPAPPICGA